MTCGYLVCAGCMSPLEWLRLNWKGPVLERASSLLLLSEGLPPVDVGDSHKEWLSPENLTAGHLPGRFTWSILSQFLLEKLGISFAQHSISSLESGQSTALLWSTPGLVLASLSCLTMAKVISLHHLISPTSGI